MKFIRLFILCIALLSISIPARADCADPAGTAGLMDYFTADNTYKFCNGTEWKTLGEGGGNPQLVEDASTCEAAKEGAMRWNASSQAPQVCNGSSWFDIAVSAPLLQNGLSVHTEAQCTGTGGTVHDTGADGMICRFTGPSCPGGWTQFKNWSATLPGTVCNGCWQATSGGHSFADTATSGAECTAYGVDVGNGCGQWDWGNCCPTIKEIGCI